MDTDFRTAVLSHVIGKLEVQPIRFIYQGSRVMGTATERSDHDFVICVDAATLEAWRRRKSLLATDRDKWKAMVFDCECDFNLVDELKFQEKVASAGLREVLLTLQPNDSAWIGALPQLSDVTLDCAKWLAGAKALNQGVKRNTAEQVRKKQLWISLYRWALLNRGLPSAEFKILGMQLYADTWAGLSSQSDSEFGPDRVTSALAEFALTALPCVGPNHAGDPAVVITQLDRGVCFACRAAALGPVDFPTGVRFLQPRFFAEATQFLRYDLLNEHQACAYRPGVLLLTISHVWDHPLEPDPTGQQLALLQSLLPDYVEPAQDYQVFFDFCSLPQRKKELSKDGQLIQHVDNYPACPYLDRLGHCSKSVFEAALKPDALPRLFSDQLDGPSIVIDLNVHAACLTRSWPYFELFVASLSGCLSVHTAEHVPLPVRLYQALLAQREAFALLDRPLLRLLKEAAETFAHPALTNLLRCVEPSLRMALDALVGSGDLGLINLLSKVLQPELKYLASLKSPVALPPDLVLLGQAVSVPELLLYLEPEPLLQRLHTFRRLGGSILVQFPPSSFAHFATLRRCCLTIFPLNDVLLHTSITCKADRWNIIDGIKAFTRPYLEED
jgi:hypothetical protein